MAAQTTADLIELDVHVFRGRVEVRHEKVLWPTSRQWERWFLLPRDTPVVTIDEIIDAVEPRTDLLLDLKCFTRSAARRIRRSVPEDRPLTVSSRSWWVLRAFRDRPATVMLRSCGNRFQLGLVRLLPGLGPGVGVVAHERLLDRETARSLRERSPHLFTWAVPTAKRGRELAEAGVTGLIVDDLTLDWPEAV